MKVIPVSSENQWHEIRSHYVGGSEVAALFGLSPYTTPFELWHIKAGNIPATDLSDVERVQAGNYMEPAIAAWASEKWGIKLRKFQGYCAHETIEGMGCTPDYTNDDASLNVQIKNVDSIQFMREWEAEGDTIIKAPMHILLQVQHELACTLAKEAWLVVCVGGNRLLRLVILPRQATILKIVGAVADFWASIKNGLEPKPDFEADAEAISILYSEVDAGKYIDMRGSNRAVECVCDYERGSDMELIGKAMKETAKAELMTMIGDAASAIITDEITVRATLVKGTSGKLITESMVGMRVGARKSYRRFSIKNIATEKEGVAA